MKLFVILSTVIVATSAATDLEKWKQFKKTHNKIYKNVVEERTRFAIFQNNLRDIEEHNSKYNEGIKTYYMGINQFADWTSDEFRKLFTFRKPAHSSNRKYVRDPNFVAPDSIDWRTEGAVLEVKNQEDCGSSWAFSVTGSIEGQNAIKNNLTISLSEQELVDCSSDYGNLGCNGGFMNNGLDYVIANGIATEKDYPYTATGGTCISTARSGVNVTSYVELDTSENHLFEGVAAIGPISTGINADILQFYKGGIFNESSCPAFADHAVLCVGYGIEDGVPFWIIKNSLGTSWGEDGYLRLIRNAHQQCGIGSSSIYPILT